MISFILSSILSISGAEPTISEQWQQAVLEACENFDNREKANAASFEDAVNEAVQFWD